MRPANPTAEPEAAAPVLDALEALGAHGFVNFFILGIILYYSCALLEKNTQPKQACSALETSLPARGCLLAVVVMGYV